MDIVTPDPNHFVLPTGSRSLTIGPPADDALPGCASLPAIVTPDGKVASQWTPTPGELALLNAGAAVTLIVWTSGRGLQPVSVGVGGMDLR